MEEMRAKLALSAREMMKAPLKPPRFGLSWNVFVRLRRHPQEAFHISLAPFSMDGVLILRTSILAGQL
jgi:hypothetical protein